jgi:amidase
MDDYTKSLKKDGLKNKKIGVIRKFTGDDYEVDWLFDTALHAMEKSGAEVVEITLPAWLLESRGHFYRAIRFPEFKSQIETYLATLDEGYPKTLDDLITQSMEVTSKQPDGVIPNPARWSLMKVENEATSLDGYEYKAVKEFALPLIREFLKGLMQHKGLDALVYPTTSMPAELVDFPYTGDGLPGSGGSNFNLANLSGFPDLSMPIGFTSLGMPVNLSIMGEAYSEPTLIEIAYSLEQQIMASRVPVNTPSL